MATRNIRMINSTTTNNPHHLNNSNQGGIAKQLCMIVVTLILCNLVTLHFLNKSVQRTSTMDCPNSPHVNGKISNHGTQSNNQFPNLLEANSPYSHLPYLPHNLKDYITTNPNNANDPKFIQLIKDYNSGKSLNIDDDNDKESEIEKEEEEEDEDESEEEGDNSIHSKYGISSDLLKPEESITIQDEINRNRIILNDQLWDINDNNNDEDVICDNTMEYLFNSSIHILHKLKSKNYMESSICPNIAKLGWRHASYVPFIFGNHCEPWWARDAVFIISRLINKNMIGIEWGTGVSSLWLAMLSNYTIAMEHDKLWQNGVNEIIEKLNLDNLLVLHEHLGRRYCELDYSDSFRNNPGGHKWSKGKIDFFSIDGRLRYPSTEWMLDWVKPHGGIVIFDNSDRIEGEDGKYGQHNATDLIPKHWLRFDSSYFKQHIEPIKEKRWLKNSMTTIWITRHEKCAKGNFDLNGVQTFQDQIQDDSNDDGEQQLNFKPF